MSVRVVNLLAHEIAPYAASLRRLERDITYPIADGGDHFYIDHGEDYAAFFTALGDKTGFLLALDGDEVVGTIAGVKRSAVVCGREVAALYLADYKVRPEYRGQRVTRGIVWHCVAMLRHRELRAPRLFYGAAMRGARGDVMRAARGSNAIMRLMRPLARLHVYFASPAALAALDPSSAPSWPARPGIDLSPQNDRDIVDTAGRKDLRLVSTGAAWPLAHLPLGPARFGANHAAYLRRCGERLVAERSSASACFALDERLVEHIEWLRAHGISPGARCTVHALRVGDARGAHDWVHLATSEI